MSILFFKKLYLEARIIGFEPDPLTYDIRPGWDSRRREVLVEDDGRRGRAEALIWESRSTHER